MEDKQCLIRELRSTSTFAIAITLLASCAYTQWNISCATFVFSLICALIIERIGGYLHFIFPCFFTSSIIISVICWLTGATLDQFQYNNTLFVKLRALHVGLLTSKAGYGSDVKTITEYVLTFLVAVIGYMVEAGCTYFLMDYFGFNFTLCYLIASTIPAPSGEFIASSNPWITRKIKHYFTQPKCPEIVVDSLSGNIAKQESKDHEVDMETSAKYHLDRAAVLMKFSGMTCTILTIIMFSSFMSGVTLITRNGDVTHELNAYSMLREGGIGVSATLGYTLVVYLVTYLLDQPSAPATAGVVFAVGAFSMISLASWFPVAAAIGAIVATLALRQSYPEFPPDSLKLLDISWVLSSPLFYAAYIFITVCYFFNDPPSCLQVYACIVTSLASVTIKAAVLFLLFLSYKFPIIHNLLLVANNCSKGTVQIALVTMVPLRAGLHATGPFMDIAMYLQLYVFINYMLCSLFSALILLFIRFKYRNENADAEIQN